VIASDISAGLLAILQWDVLLFLVVGALLGAAFGALPGLTATMGVAVLTPLTFWVSTEKGLAMLLGIYCGAIPAGGIPAVLINIPGTPASIAATWDGYPLARRGEPGLALGINVMFSFVGQLVSILFLAFAAFPIASFGLRFGPAEYFGLALFGISLMAGVSRGNVLKGMLAGMLGLALATIGLDPMTAYPRYNFSSAEFLDGIAFVPVMIGLFGLGEVLARMTEAPAARQAVAVTLGRVWPAARDWRRMLPSGLLGSSIGTLVGAIPAAGGDIASVIAWEQARRVSRRPEEFTKGSVEGLAASSSAANAAIGGAMTTMLTLGIPGDAPSAVLIGALLIHGVQPGPLLFRDHGALVYSIIFLMILAAAFIALLGLAGARPLARALRIPDPWLWAGVIVLGVVGSYALNNSLTDVWLMFAAGILGLLCRKTAVPIGPLVLGLILGPMMEANLRRALILSRGDWQAILAKPLALLFLAGAVASLLWPLWKAFRTRGRTQAGNPGRPD
jgi:putative tricarboxylic transport membrane protein